MNVRISAALAVAAALLVGGAHAASTPAVFTTNDFGFDPLFSSPDTIGFEFTANTRIVVDQLGVFDSGQDGLTDGHLVGLWDANGNLLVSVLVEGGTGAPLIDLHRYASITPTVLKAGQSYFVGAYHADFADTPADISYTPKVDPRISLGNYGLGNAGGFTAPNFIIPPRDYANFTISSVPEPSTWALMLMGFGALGVASRRNRGGLMAPTTTRVTQT